MASGLRFNANIGTKRLSSKMTFSQAEYTRSARSDMQRIINNYRKLVAHIEDVTPEILYSALQPTFQLSKVYCPEDTGRMVASGYLEITQFRGVPTVEIGYGRGSEPPYTAAVHENMEWKHKSPTRAKWLQHALGEDASAIQDRIVNGYETIGF